ncbi:hypothetical protein CCR94_23995 [Rhodoblastus sphagnicola]|uniref:Uncharacterized protein n=1 Tax=Rhodoblastus sphagnicola TaxID=333368 RepID=A0A2S6MTZ8_9HYPH|nr:hypothetical protein [Rhodoblastus sphagnicola]MBB4199776.1 hypothetical protein [Rhodoblastus sphagnicola]PPQ25836.1 hypothetical protein CCR94_23995 [Rhodoblastus sphagnicola]
MDSEIAEIMELALIHMLYARAELEVSSMDAVARQRARDHVDEAVRQLQMLASQRGQSRQGDAA